MFNKEERSLYFQSNELVKKQVDRIANYVLSGEVRLPVDKENVLHHLEPNFQFYFGTLTRRIHHENHSLDGPLSNEAQQANYDKVLNHIGHVVNSRCTSMQPQGEVIYVDFGTQQIQQDLEQAG